MTRLIFWQNEPSLHMAPLVKALAALPHNDVHVITEWALSEDRRALGWSNLDHGDAEVHVCPSDASRRYLETTLAEGSYHVFSGLGAYPKTTGSLRAISAYRPAHVAVFSEPWNPYGFRKHARRLKFFLRKTSLDRVIDTYLLAGATARSQFADLGVSKEKLFPFAYFVGQVSRPLEVSFPPATGFSIVFVGKLEQRKNVSLLLRALSEITRPWRLTIIGDGPSADELKTTASNLGILSRVQFLGAKDNTAAREGITLSDLLVLPSRFDGWGAVVNEALHAGVPVVLSSAVGSADLLAHSDRDCVFQSDDVISLRLALDQAIRRGRPTRVQRSDLMLWANDTIGPAAGANYLMGILDRDASRASPVAPWHIARNL